MTISTEKVQEVTLFKILGTLLALDNVSPLKPQLSLYKRSTSCQIAETSRGD